MPTKFLIRFNIAQEIERILLESAEGLEPFDTAFSPDIRTADPRYGDFQANGVLPFAKRKRLNPRETALRLVEGLKSSGTVDPNMMDVDVAGPGFINFRLTPSFLLKWLQKYRNLEDLRAAAGGIYRRRRVVVDYSSPNTAKQMHVGHIRSTIIGESISLLLEFCGADVIRDNHIGDWGTQFGLLMAFIKRQGYNLDSPSEDPLADLETFYKRGVALAGSDKDFLETARQELVKLQQGDAYNLKLWEGICKVSYQAFKEIYTMLDIRFDKVLGESFYRDKVDRVYNELTEAGLAQESEGALVIFFPEHPRFNQQPFIVRKSDSASNYATTDLATVLYRCEAFKADEVIYVTDTRQKDHFEQLFLAVQKWFEFKGYALPVLQHITFGTILGEDGKAIKTRSGEPIKLKDLLNEAIDRAYGIVMEKSADLPEAERREIARTVGIAAIRYADLMQNRTTDYVFSWEKLLSFEGNTAPYLLYAVARIHSIFRKLNLNPGEGEEASIPFQTESEINLARKHTSFVTVLNQAISELRPHFLCTYLYDLVGAFNVFYKHDKVMVEDPVVRARRVLLCARTLSLLETGLHLLGIKTLKRM